MSYTKIYAFDKSGNASLYAEIKNAWRGAMAIWGIMEERHLPPYIPDYVKSRSWYRPGIESTEVFQWLGYRPTRLMPSLFTRGEEIKNPAQEVWNLVEDQAVPEHERIVLFTTFDKTLVRKEDLPRVIEAFRKFEGETSLSEQADILEKLCAEQEVIAVGWNQTSVSCDTWTAMGGYDEETGECIPYNCLTMDKHFWLFDALKGADDEKAN